MLRQWHEDRLAGRLDESDYHAWMKGATIADIRFDPILRAWLEGSPQSYVAHAVYAQYCYAILYLYRGTATGNTVTPFRQLKMQEWGWKTFKAAKQALTLDHGGDPSVTYECLINLMRVWGGGEGVDADELPQLSEADWSQIHIETFPVNEEEFEHDYWLRRAFAEAPASFEIHNTALYNLTPQWGGSEQEMEALVAESESRLSPVDFAWLRKCLYENLSYYHSCFQGDAGRGRHFRRLADAIDLASIAPELATKLKENARLDELYEDARNWLYDEDSRGAQKALKLLQKAPPEQRAANSVGGWFELLGRTHWTLDDYPAALDSALIALKIGNIGCLEYLPMIFTDDNSPLREDPYGWQIIEELVAMDHGMGYRTMGHVLGWGLFGREADIPAAWPYAMAAAHRGEVTPMNTLAQYFFVSDRRGMPADPAFALDLYFWGADTMGDNHSMLHLGRTLAFGASRFGQDVPTDLENGFHWLRAAVNKGENDAAFWLGNMYAEGLYVDQNFQAALAWYDQCVEDNSTEWREEAAIHALLLVENELDDKSATKKYIDALKDSQNANTCFEVGDYYRFIAEKYDQPSHYRPAVAWLRRSAQLGHENADAVANECESKLQPGLLRRLASKLGW
ncbi:DUF4034 domain-containing protein [Chromobacterium sp. IIBBL 290-4]|nr:DUF4034 domain-containing protein [Chromobacterium sp. IIBBL 290-4]UTH73675.1 DUF4034 domain-containing protein [Chromobacterium sp. IIBBL 290-4]